jgi:hypothetical protein
MGEKPNLYKGVTILAQPELLVMVEGDFANLENCKIIIKK